MSAIRIPVAIPLVMLALKSAVKDNSSYVKRAAACAIPKLHSLDAEGEQTEQLVEFIADLLSSIEPIVLGSALFAYQAVCPTRWDLIHPHYRKVCHLLADFDEWGQVVALQMLLRYGRTQFLSPFTRDTDTAVDATDTRPALGLRGAKAGKAGGGGGNGSRTKKKKKSASFYSDEEEEEESPTPSESDEESSDDASGDEAAAPAVVLDEDHALLLRQSQSLLQSSNTAVILSIATLHWYLAPAPSAPSACPPSSASPATAAPSSTCSSPTSSPWPRRAPTCSPRTSRTSTCTRPTPPTSSR